MKSLCFLETYVLNNSSRTVLVVLYFKFSKIRIKVVKIFLNEEGMLGTSER